MAFCRKMDNRVRLITSEYQIYRCAIDNINAFMNVIRRIKEVRRASFAGGISHTIYIYDGPSELFNRMAAYGRADKAAPTCNQ
jgi:hypothetical protein